jgi:hypothetical protein
LNSLCLQSRHSTTWPTPPVHFSLVTFEWGLTDYLSGLALNHDPPILSLPSI